MSLRARLLSVTIALAILVTVLFGLVAYRITVQSAVTRESEALTEKARLLAAYVRTETALTPKGRADADQLRALVEPLIKGETAVWIDAPAVVMRLESRGTLSAETLSALTAAMQGGTHSGTPIEVRNGRYLFAEYGSPNTARVRIIRETHILDQALAIVAQRLVLTGVAAVWIALWGGLILTAAVARRQERHHAELAYRAHHDDLTGLPNRTKLQHCLNAASASAKNGALLVMDLDRFKEVNDTLGHRYGDELLRGLGPRLTTVLRQDDLLARLGGDEFAIWLPDADSAQGMDVARRIIASLKLPLKVMDMPLEVNASIGIACFPLHTDCMEELVRYADVSMYHAKRNRLGAFVYEPDNDHHSVMRLRLAGEIRTALDDAQFVLYFQPKVKVADGSLTGVEALVRWQHPEFGLLSPDRFIDLVEQSGLIHDFTFHVLERALSQCASWRGQGMECPVAVNLSAFDLMHPRFAENVLNAVERHGLLPDMLELELTETAAMWDIEHTASTFAELSRHGVQLAIDDFGTGMSSLAYLTSLPSCAIKIDRSFVMDMRFNPQNSIIVRSIVALADNLQRTCVAEGVEDEETLDQLRRMGCDFAQGYLFSRPLPAGEELLATLRRLARGRTVLGPLCGGPGGGLADSSQSGAIKSVAG